MSLSNALFSSVSGLNTASTAISVIGDNIANVSTPGFRERKAVFGDVLGQAISTSGGFSQTGSGSQVLDVNQIFTQGSFEASSRETDLAIEGQGFFVMENPQGRSYSRAGIFDFDRNGLLTGPSGGRVQGFGIDPLTLQSTGQLGDIQLQSSVSAPRATTQVDLSANLQVQTGTPVGPFDPSNPTGTSDFLSVITLHDSLGGAHPATVYFTQSGANAWDWNVTLPPGDTTIAPATPGDPQVVQGGGTLTFNTNGLLTATTGNAVTFQFSGGTTPGQVVQMDFGTPGGLTATTQFASAPSTVNTQTQDGFGPGTLTGIAIDATGFLTASFSNGETRPVAQVALATFNGVEGLQSVGGNQWVESRESGQPIIGQPQSGRFGAVRSSSIEQSNVDLAEQFIRLIQNQRAFQANTRTVSTTNELLANLVQLGQ